MVVGLDVVLVTRMTDFDNGTFTNLFSVSGSVVQQTGSRVIVTHQGDDLGMGTWHCTKDKWTACSHSRKAQDYLQKVLTGDPSAIAGVVPKLLVDAQEARECRSSNVRMDLMMSFRDNSCRA